MIAKNLITTNCMKGWRQWNGHTCRLLFRAEVVACLCANAHDSRLTTHDSRLTVREICCRDDVIVSVGNFGIGPALKNASHDSRLMIILVVAACCAQNQRGRLQAQAMSVLGQDVARNRFARKKFSNNQIALTHSQSDLTKSKSQQKQLNSNNNNDNNKDEAFLCPDDYSCHPCHPVDLGTPWSRRP